MDAKTQKSLEEAKACFYSWRLLETYNILRRYFDRLPFKPEPAHAEYIGFFARTLLELGKENELKFYMGELERLYERSKAPAIAYTLGVVYTFISEPRMELARELFEEIIRNPAAKDYQVKARITLANYYDRVKNDRLACRMLIDGIEPPSDPALRTLVDIWKAKLLREEGHYERAEKSYLELLAGLSPQTDWHGYFSAKVGLALLYLDGKRSVDAEKTIAEIRVAFSGHNFKSVQAQITKLEDKLRDQSAGGKLLLVSNDSGSRLIYANKSLEFKRRSPGETLFTLLVRRRFLDKSLIVKNLYNREYNGESDDKLIYYHVHALRKRLRELGLPASAIMNVDNGYRLVPSVELAGGEL